MLFDYFDVETFYPNILARLTTTKPRTPSNKSHCSGSVCHRAQKWKKIEPGLTIIENGKIVYQNPVSLSGVEEGNPLSLYNHQD